MQKELISTTHHYIVKDCEEFVVNKMALTDAGFHKELVDAIGEKEILISIEFEGSLSVMENENIDSIISEFVIEDEIFVSINGSDSEESAELFKEALEKGVGFETREINYLEFIRDYLDREKLKLWLKDL